MTNRPPASESPALPEWLDRVPLMPLGPGRPESSLRKALAAIEDVQLAPAGVADRQMIDACRSGLWLAFDFLDESHKISQEIKTAEGSYWHAIMHRREPDPSNSKYWWRRVGPHPVLRQLREQAPALGYTFTSADDFVDFCEEVRGSGSEQEQQARKVQLLEWRLLFDWCRQHGAKR